MTTNRSNSINFQKLEVPTGDRTRSAHFELKKFSKIGSQPGIEPGPLTSTVTTKLLVPLTQQPQMKQKLGLVQKIYVRTERLVRFGLIFHFQINSNNRLGLDLFFIK